MKDYKICEDRYYVYPNTTLEANFIAGTATFPEGKDLYMNVTAYFSGVKDKYPDNADHIFQYDYYILSVKEPEWSEGQGPQTYTVTVTDTYSLNPYMYKYSDGEWSETDGTDILEGDLISIQWNNTSYTMSSSDVDLEVTADTMTFKAEFTMPDDDVEVTVVEATQTFTIAGDTSKIEVYDSDSTQHYSGDTIPYNTSLTCYVDNTYDLTFSQDIDVDVHVETNTDNNKFVYSFNMPLTEELTITVVPRAQRTITIDNTIGATLDAYDWTSRSFFDMTQQPLEVYEGHDIVLECHTAADKLILNPAPEYRQWADMDNGYERYNYGFYMPANNIDCTVATRNVANIGWSDYDVEFESGSTPTLPTPTNPDNLTVTYKSSDISIATVDSSGNISVTNNAGVTYIAIVFAGDGTYDYTETMTKLTCVEPSFATVIRKSNTVDSYTLYNFDEESNFNGSVKAGQKVGLIGTSSILAYNHDNGIANSLQVTDYSSEYGSPACYFEIPQDVHEYSEFLITATTDAMHTINSSTNSLFIFANGIGNWITYGVDPNDPSRYIMQYPANTNIGLESRNGEQYTLTPYTELQSGSSVGKYFTMPDSDLIIDEANTIRYSASAKLAEVTGSSNNGLHTDAFSGANGVLTITSHTFDNSEGKIVFDGYVTNVGDYAFYECTGMTNVSLPNSVTSIGNRAFFDCTALTNVVIPNNVTNISNRAFNYCTSLTSITIPDSVTTIGDEIWGSCRGVTSITIGSGLTLLPFGVFKGCSRLTTVTIPNNITQIISSVFSDCTSLTSITIPNSVTQIGSDAFRGCSGLTTVIIGSAVTSLGSSVFFNCNGLTSITCNATTAPTFGNDSFYQVAATGDLYVPTGSDYSTWTAILTGWTVHYI